MTFEQRVVVGLIILGLIALVVRLVTRRQLSVDQGLLWTVILAGCEMLLFIPGVLDLLTTLTGAEFPVSAITLVALVVLVILLLQLSVTLARLQHRHQQLAQSIALMERRLRRSLKEV